MTEYTTVEGHPIRVGKFYELRSGEKSMVVNMSPEGKYPVIMDNGKGINKEGYWWGSDEESPSDVMRPYIEKENFNEAVHKFMTKIDTETSSPTFSDEIPEVVDAINIRDDFAIAGLPMVRDLMLSIIARDRSAGFPDPSEMARLAYQFADAMLEARKEKKDEQ